MYIFYNDFYSLHTENSGVGNLGGPINRIVLQNNGLTRFESSVFYSIIKTMFNLENPQDQHSFFYSKPIRSVIDISHSTTKNIYLIVYIASKTISLFIVCVFCCYSDPIDCNEDPCHLAWIIRDNPHLLKWLQPMDMVNIEKCD